MIEPTEEMISRVVAAATAAVLQELGHGEPAARADEPEWMSDPDIQRNIVKVGRTKYYELSRQDGFPPGIRLGRSMYRRTVQVRAWLAAQGS